MCKRLIVPLKSVRSFQSFLKVSAKSLTTPTPCPHSRWLRGHRVRVVIDYANMVLAFSTTLLISIFRKYQFSFFVTFFLFSFFFQSKIISFVDKEQQGHDLLVSQERVHREICFSKKDYKVEYCFSRERHLKTWCLSRARILIEILFLKTEYIWTVVSHLRILLEMLFLKREFI